MKLKRLRWKTRVVSPIESVPKKIVAPKIARRRQPSADTWPCRTRPAFGCRLESAGSDRSAVRTTVVRLVGAWPAIRSARRDASEPKSLSPGLSLFADGSDARCVPEAILRHEELTELLLQPVARLRESARLTWPAGRLSTAGCCCGIVPGVDRDNVS